MGRPHGVEKGPATVPRLAVVILRTKLKPVSGSGSASTPGSVPSFSDISEFTGCSEISYGAVKHVEYVPLLRHPHPLMCVWDLTGAWSIHHESSSSGCY